jgi:predicted RNase H-like HicB family nuclease
LEGVAGGVTRVYALSVPAATGGALDFTVELEKEADGRWIAEVLELPGVLAYGDTQEEAVAKAQALALRVVADRLEHGEAQATLTIRFKAA